MTATGVALVGLVCAVIAILLAIIAVYAPLVSRRTALRKRLESIGQFPRHTKVVNDE